MKIYKKWWFYLLIFILLILLIPKAFNFYTESKYKDMFSDLGGIPNNKLCEKKELGWSCKMNEKGDVIDFFGYSFGKKRLNEICNKQGGRLDCYAECYVGGYHTCLFPFEDVGKSCNDSVDCRGECLVYDNEISAYAISLNQGFKSTGEDIYKNINKVLSNNRYSFQCAAYDMSVCDMRLEVKGGEIIMHSTICS